MTVETRFADTMREFLERCEILDLTHPLEEGIPSHPEHSRYFHNLWNSYWHGEESVTYQVLLNEHTGTHVDAPAHFVRDGNKSHLWIDELPPTQLWGPCSVIDVRGYAGRQSYDIDVFDRFEANHGEVKPGESFCSIQDGAASGHCGPVGVSTSPAGRDRRKFSVRDRRARGKGRRL